MAVISLLFYGSTLPTLIRWLRIPADDPEEQQVKLDQLMAQLDQAGRTAVDPETPTIDGRPADAALVADITERYRRAHRTPWTGGAARAPPDTSRSWRFSAPTWPPCAMSSDLSRPSAPTAARFSTGRSPSSTPRSAASAGRATRLRWRCV